MLPYPTPRVSRTLGRPEVWMRGPESPIPVSGNDGSSLGYRQKVGGRKRGEDKGKPPAPIRTEVLQRARSAPGKDPQPVDRRLSIVEPRVSCVLREIHAISCGL